MITVDRKICLVMPRLIEIKIMPGRIFLLIVFCLILFLVENFEIFDDGHDDDDHNYDNSL